MATMTSPPIKGQFLLDHACNATAAAASQVRLMIDRRIPAWGLPVPEYSEVRENLALVVTELVNNAVGETPDREIRIQCSRDLRARIIRVGVWDSSDRSPKAAMPDLTPETLDLRAENFDANGGWGLPIVQALSTACGVEPTSGGGKWVWANISLDGDNSKTANITRRGEKSMTVQSVLSPEQLTAKAEQMQTLAALIQAYPTEAQLIMLAIEDGLTLGPVQITQDSRPIVIRMDEAGNLHAPGDFEVE